MSWAIIVGAQAQDDLDSLDAWVRSMQPDPFIRCGEEEWSRALEETREMWLGGSYLEHVRMVNTLLQVLQDSHTTISAYDWIWDVESAFGTLPIRWAIEGRALWVLDSGLPELPEQVRILSLNGLPAEDIVAAAIDLAPREGQSAQATSRIAAHNVLSWVLGTTRKDSLAVTWVDSKLGLPVTKTWPTLRRRDARKAWQRISSRRPVVHWTFPDGSLLTARDIRRNRRVQNNDILAGKKPKVTTHFNGATTLKISSFSAGSWWSYQKRLYMGFRRLTEIGGPLVVDLRGNPGGQSPRMELLWNHLATKSTHLPWALVAKQSDITAKANARFYKRLRKRWVDRHLDSSSDARYIHAMATLPLGETDTLFFPRKHPRHGSYRGDVAVLIDGESASASVSFAGAIQSTGRGTLIGESCMGPANGTMGNPYLQILPVSGIVVSLSTAIYMAQPCNDWAATQPIQPDLLVPNMMIQSEQFDETVDDWIKTKSRRH